MVAIVGGMDDWERRQAEMLAEYDATNARNPWKHAEWPDTTYRGMAGRDSGEVIGLIGIKRAPADQSNHYGLDTRREGLIALSALIACAVILVIAYLAM